MSDINLRYCFKCQENTPTIDEDCTVCGLSKITPDHLKDKNHVDYMNRCLNEETNHENFAKYDPDKTGSLYRYWAYHFYQIYPAVNAIGGWANFSHWVMKHAESYFRYCENHKNILAELVRLKKIKDESESILDEQARNDAINYYYSRSHRVWNEASKLVSEQMDYTDNSSSMIVTKKLWNQLKTNKMFLDGLVSGKDAKIKELERTIIKYESKGALALITENEALKIRLSLLEK